eukprot:TRINITY_DN4779_c1_g1_i7.p1 TRINITY_DN4779_c1_g1~~TRINITY_DN4779_c1_g1_i7.p1  ORF type:complete len:576 (-),score=53.99 TRINITY_DN4779_c1_g1_i7:256-1935(-)
MAYQCCDLIRKLSKQRSLFVIQHKAYTRSAITLAEPSTLANLEQEEQQLVRKVEIPEAFREEIKNQIIEKLKKQSRKEEEQQFRKKQLQIGDPTKFAIVNQGSTDLILQQLSNIEQVQDDRDLAYDEAKYVDLMSFEERQQMIKEYNDEKRKYIEVIKQRRRNMETDSLTRRTRNWLKTAFNFRPNDLMFVEDSGLLDKPLTDLELNGDLLLKVYAGYENVPLNSMIAKAPEILMMPYETLENRMTVWLQQVQCRPEVVGYDPTVLCMPISCIRDMENALQKIGFKAVQAKEVIRRYPRVIHMNIDDIATQVEYVNGWLKDKTAVFSILCVVPDVLHMSQAAVDRRFEWFQARGFSVKETIKQLKDTPKLLSWGPQKLEVKWRKLESLGLKPSQVRRMVLHMSQILTKDLRSEKQQMKFKFMEIELFRNPMNALLEFPGFLQYSLQERIGPRYLYLRLKHKAKIFSLEQVLSCSDHKFATQRARTSHLEYRKFLTGEWRVRHWPWLEQRLKEAIKEQERRRGKGKREGDEDEDDRDAEEEDDSEDEDDPRNRVEGVNYG